MKLSMATPPSSMSPAVSFRWEVTGCEEVTLLDRDDGRGGESKRSLQPLYSYVGNGLSFPGLVHLLWMVCHLLIVVLVRS